MNEKEISNFGSAQSHKQTENAREGPRSGNDALLLRGKKNSFTFTATAEVRSTVQTFFSISNCDFNSFTVLEE